MGACALGIRTLAGCGCQQSIEHCRGGVSSSGRAGFLDQTADNTPPWTAVGTNNSALGSVNGSTDWWAAAAALAPTATKAVVRDESWLPPRSWTGTDS